MVGIGTRCLVATAPSIERRGPEFEPAVLVQCRAEAAGFFIRKPTILCGPLGEEPLQLTDALRPLRIERSICKRFDTHCLALIEKDMRIEDDRAVFYVPGIRPPGSSIRWFHAGIVSRNLRRQFGKSVAGGLAACRAPT
jgi:hypothetical protein